MFKNPFKSEIVTEEDILAIKDGKWTWKGKELDDDTLGKLRAQAVNFKDSLLWKVLRSEVQWVAIKTLLEKGKDGGDIRAAQLLGHSTQIIDKKLLTMSKES